MSTRHPEKFPTPLEKISTRHLKKFRTPPEKYHLYRKNLTPLKIILTPLKFLNPHPRKFVNPPPKNFPTPPPPKKISHPPPKISQPPPPKISQPPLKISQPHSKKYQPKKYVKRYPPPLQHPFFSFSFLSLFLHFSKKNLKISGGGG